MDLGLVSGRQDMRMRCRVEGREKYCGLTQDVVGEEPVSWHRHVPYVTNVDVHATNQSQNGTPIAAEKKFFESP
jgi:hypothetical protein